MKIKFYTLSALLRTTSSLLCSAYFALGINLIVFILIHQYNYFSILLCFIGLIICMAQHYYSIRIKFDAELLNKMAEVENTIPLELGIEQNTRALDQALADFGLKKTSEHFRPWDLRFQACLKLFKIQISLLVLQYLLLILLLAIYKGYAS